jgi:hypothetical protein
MSKIRIPSVLALVLGIYLMSSANWLAGPRQWPDGAQTDRQWVIRTSATTGGVLIFLFAAAEMLHSLVKRRPEPPPQSGSDREHNLHRP